VRKLALVAQSFASVFMSLPWRTINRRLAIEGKVLIRLPNRKDRFRLLNTNNNREEILTRRRVVQLAKDFGIPVRV
jgi:hypothetical protein